jgi:geranylgeranyl diphosphate synthase type II
MKNPWLSHIESALSAAFPAQSGPAGQVAEAARYSLLGGGKRLRPSLLLEFFTLCGGKNPEAALPFACGIEMIHTYSLIHDDLPCMDDDDTRRGRPACHAAFGEATALLAGDALLTRAFGCMAESPGIPGAHGLSALGYIAARAGMAGMIGGQAMDLALEGAEHVPPKTHENMVLGKTGALFAASCVGGCILAGAGELQIQAAESFAAHFGLAFQLTDDVLDVVGDPALLGKPVGSDARREKRTFVSLYGLETCKTMAEAELSAAKSALSAFPPSPWLESLLDGLTSRQK